MLIAEELGFEVHGPATDATSSLRLANANPPDIAVIDVNLTDGPTGPSIAAHLASTFGTSVLIVSANPGTVTEGKDGVVAVLKKPLKEEELASILSKLASRRANA